MLVAISRTEDYRHHWQDVFIGGLLGAGCAYFAYRQYYPSLIHVECHNPYSARFGSCSDDPEQQEQQLPAPGTIVYTSHDDGSSITSSQLSTDDRYKHSYPVK